jgi:hypothetical protein
VTFKSLGYCTVPECWEEHCCLLVPYKWLLDALHQESEVAFSVDDCNDHAGCKTSTPLQPPLPLPPATTAAPLLRHRHRHFWCNCCCCRRVCDAALTTCCVLVSLQLRSQTFGATTPSTAFVSDRKAAARLLHLLLVGKRKRACRLYQGIDQSVIPCNGCQLYVLLGWMYLPGNFVKV